MTTPEAVFQRVTQALDTAGIPYMLTGSFASGIHGVTRATQDIDIVVAPTPPRLQQFIRGITAAFYADESATLEALANEGQLNVIELASGTTLSVATIEDIILAKLERAALGGSERQIEDVAALLRLHGDRIDRVYLDQWIDQLGTTPQWSRAERMAEG